MRVEVVHGDGTNPCRGINPFQTWVVLPKPCQTPPPGRGSANRDKEAVQIEANEAVNIEAGEAVQIEKAGACDSSHASTRFPAAAWPRESAVTRDGLT